MGEVRTFSVADVITLFGMVSAAIIGGIGAAMGWFKSSNKKRDDRITAVEGKLELHKDFLASLDKRSALIEACQKTIGVSLEDIKEGIDRSAERGAHSVNEQIAKLVNEVQKIVTHNPRRHE